MDHPLSPLTPERPEARSVVVARGAWRMLWPGVVALLVLVAYTWWVAPVVSRWRHLWLFVNAAYDHQLLQQAQRAKGPQGDAGDARDRR